jgi:hypothetical protein
VVKRWQQRYFVVAGHYLKYADSEEAVIASPKATVDLDALRGCTITRGAFLKLTFDDNMALDLQAATPEEADCWHDVLANFAPKDSERKSDLMQSLEHYAPRKGTLVFERKGSASGPSSVPSGTSITAPNSSSAAAIVTTTLAAPALLSPSRSIKPTALQRITAIEVNGIGSVQTGALIQRIKEAEVQVFGEVGTGTPNDRLTILEEGLGII